MRIGNRPGPAAELGVLVVGKCLLDLGGLIQSMPPEFPEDWLVPFADQEAAEAALKAESIAGYYVIAADYAESGKIELVKQSSGSPSTGPE